MRVKPWDSIRDSCSSAALITSDPAPVCAAGPAKPWPRRPGATACKDATARFALCFANVARVLKTLRAPILARAPARLSPGPIGCGWAC